MAPKRKAVDIDQDIRGNLAKLLRKDSALIGNIRKTDEETPRISVIDVARVITGSDSRDSAQMFRRIIEAHPEVEAKCFHLKFPGRGQRDTPVADLPTIIEIIFLLPGKTAARIRNEAAKLFVRYLGGDLSLVQEVKQMAHVQEYLRENAPEHPMLLFAAAANTVQHHLKGITDADIVDTTGYGNDPYKLLERGILLAGDDGRLKSESQLKPSDFLKSEIPKEEKIMVPSILGQFSSELMRRKLNAEGDVYLHMSMGRPRVAYFEEDRPLMQQVLGNMDEYIAWTRQRLREKAVAFLNATSG
jgi:hypothetical protein